MVKTITQHLKFITRHKLINIFSTLLWKTVIFDYFLVYLQILLQKSCIRETPTLSTFADNQGTFLQATEATVGDCQS